MKYKIFFLISVFLVSQIGVGDLTNNIEIDEGFFQEIKPPPVDKKSPKKVQKESLKRSLKQQMNASKRSAGNTNAKQCKIYFKGEQFKGSRENSLIELKGNVVVTRCGLEVKSNEARIYLEEESKEVKTIEAKGNVRLKNYDEKLKENISASGERLVYSRKQNRINLIGTRVSRASLKKGKDRFSGPTIEYDIDSGWVKARKVEGVVHGGSF